MPDFKWCWWCTVKGAKWNSGRSNAWHRSQKVCSGKIRHTIKEAMSESDPDNRSRTRHRGVGTVRLPLRVVQRLRCPHRILRGLSLRVCSIFLLVDRSIIEKHKPMALFTIQIFDKKYVFIYYWNFYVHIFSIKLANPFKNTYFKEIGLFQKFCCTAVEINKN